MIEPPLIDVRAGIGPVHRDEPKRARLIEKNGRKVLVAPPGAPPMTPAVVKALLADFP